GADAGWSDAGQSAPDRLDAGRSDAGRSAPDRPDAGQSAPDRPDAGRSDAGRSAPDRPDAGQSAPDRPDAGRSDAGRSAPDRPDAGQSAPDRLVAGRPESGAADAAGRAFPGPCSCGGAPGDAGGVVLAAGLAGSRPGLGEDSTVSERPEPARAPGPTGPPRAGTSPAPA